MQLAEFEVKGLFGQFDHLVPFPERQEDEAEPSLVLLHGPNGVGKTTVLQMLQGFMQLDFDIFRRSPFKWSRLSFSDGPQITVERTKHKAPALRVTYGPHQVVLDGSIGKKGALESADRGAVEMFRAGFYAATEGIAFDLIDTSRQSRLIASEERAALGVMREAIASVGPADAEQRRLLRQLERQNQDQLSRRVQRFIADAQVEYRRFFSTTEPDLFAVIIERLKGDNAESAYSPTDLVGRLMDLRDRDQEHERLGIEPDRWNFDQISQFLATDLDDTNRNQSLALIGAYVEMLESRSRERQVVAQRLVTFEQLMDDFLLGKVVNVSRKNGLAIRTEQGEELSEWQLSSGEFHLTYLMVSALTTQRRGTVLAIDEPEMSMHIAWQRKLVRSLVECASNAAPQFIFATHSPDVVANYASNMIKLGPDE